MSDVEMPEVNQGTMAVVIERIGYIKDGVADLKLVVNALAQSNRDTKEAVDRAMAKGFTEMRQSIDVALASYVTKSEMARRDDKIGRLEKVVYSQVGVIMLAFIGAIVTIVFNKPGVGS